MSAVIGLSIFIYAIMNTFVVQSTIVQCRFYVKYDYYIKLSKQQRRMMAGEAVAILICAAIALVFIFYLVTRYFNYRLQKSLQQIDQTYSMVEGLQVPNQQIEYDEYEQFVDHKINEWDERDNQRKKMFLQLAEIGQNSSIRSPLYTINDDLNMYGEFPKSSIPVMPESMGSFRSTKSIYVEKIEQSWFGPSGTHNFNKMSERSVVSNMYQPSPVSSASPSATTHRFISKLISYTGYDITIVENNITQIWRNVQRGKIRQKRTIRKRYINAGEDNFQDMLESYGFESQVPSAFKFESVVQIKNMKPQIVYSISQLNARISKQQITLAQFEQLVKQLQHKQN